MDDIQRDPRWEDVWAEVQVPSEHFDRPTVELYLMFRVVVLDRGMRFYTQILVEKADLERHPKYFGQVWDQMVKHLDAHMEDAGHYAHTRGD